MKYIAYALVLMFGFAMAAVGAEIKFRANWNPPLNDDGTPQKVSQYVLYVCDEPMPDVWGNELSGQKFVGSCPNGTLMTCEIPGDSTSYEGVYKVKAKRRKVDVHFRLTSRELLEDGSYIETDPSNPSLFVHTVGGTLNKPRDLKAIEVK